MRKHRTLVRLAKLQGWIDARVVRDQNNRLSDIISEHLENECANAGEWDEAARLSYLQKFHETLKD